jgi:hypothetical protein
VSLAMHRQTIPATVEKSRADHSKVSWTLWAFMPESYLANVW